MTRVADVSAHNGRRFVSLRGRSEFNRIYRYGRRTRAGEVVVITAAGVEGPAQVGFVAGKRVGNAVQRNRVKRRLRAAAAQVPLPHGIAYIVIAREGVNEATFEELVGWLERGMMPEPSEDTTT